jgi:hypothetical protein
MAKKRRSRRSRSHRRRSHTAVRHRRHRSNPIRYMNTRRRRRANASLGGFSSSDLLWMGGGALANGVACRAIPQMFFPQYNTGMSGYLANGVTGAALAWLAGKFNRRLGQGAWIGLIVALGQRIISDNFGAGTGGQTGGMSGDLDFSLGYYLNDPFPFAQGPSAGPYPAFPGVPYSPALPTANAAAPARARQTAALVAAGAPTVTGGGSSSVAQPGAQAAAYQPGAWG